MKLGLISDVHADFTALELAWAHLMVRGAERIVCAGDVVGYGPSPDRVAAFLAEHQVATVRGNHDRWALQRGPGCPDEFGGAPPSAETLNYLETLEPYLLVHDGARVGVVVHATPRSDMEFINPHTHPPATLRRYLEELNVDLLMCGHTHRPMWYRCERGLVVNPGSVVSIPRMTQTSRTFALVDLAELSVSFHDVESGEAVEVTPWG